MTTQYEEPSTKKHHSAAPVTMEVVCGAAAGAALGALAGPPGMAIGAAIGGAVGVGAGLALRATEIQREQDDAQLDEDIGVFGGHLGEVQPEVTVAAGAPRADEVDDEVTPRL